jgi:hypothetical protein
MTNILKKLKDYKKVEIYLPYSKNNISRCKEISEKILSFNPSRVLYHSAPWDTVGYIVLSYLGNYQIERYLINLTDHAFWLGCNCIDYILEFRSYGANISIDYRHISSNKLMIMPYYPIQNKLDEFQGFPFNTENKKIIVSGGSLYKIYGSPVFFDIVKHILKLYSDVIFFYLGNGDIKPLVKFIEENNLSKRFFYSRERKDISEIIKRCYFYLNTYPVGGGLLPQLAVINDKIPITYTDKKYINNNTDELFINNKNQKFTFYDFDSFYFEINKLITDSSYYIQKTNDLKNKVIASQNFSLWLFSILEKKESVHTWVKYDVDIDSFRELYFIQGNKYPYKYPSYFFIRKSIFVFVFFIHYTLYYTIIKALSFLKILFKSGNNAGL